MTTEMTSHLKKKKKTHPRLLQNPPLFLPPTLPKRPRRTQPKHLLPTLLKHRSLQQRQHRRQQRRSPPRRPRPHQLQSLLTMGEAGETTTRCVQKEEEQETEALHLRRCTKL